MSEQQYDLFFGGQVLEGHFVDFVKADIQQLFKADDKYVDSLFSGQEQVIKRKVDKPTAIKFQQAFKKAGAKLIVKAHNPTIQPQVKPSQTSTPATNKANTTSTREQVSEFQLITTQKSGENADNLIEKHQPDINAPSVIPNWALSAPGAQLIEPSTFQPVDIDTSDLSVADVGANLSTQQGFEEPAPFIDVSAISLADVGATIDVLDDKPAPVSVDISHIRLE